MARTRKKELAPAETATAEQDTSFNPAEFDPALQAEGIVHAVAESTRIEPEQAAESEAANTSFAERHAPGHIANPSSTRRESHASSVRKLPSTLSIAAGDMLVRLIDKGDNAAGIGIRIELPEGRKLSDEEKDIVRKYLKGEEGVPSGYTWDQNNAMWHKPILLRGEDAGDVPPSRPVAIRLDAERRVAALSEALREHQKDPAGYAEMVKEQREKAASASRFQD